MNEQQKRIAGTALVVSGLTLGGAILHQQNKLDGEVVEAQETIPKNKLDGEVVEAQETIPKKVEEAIGNDKKTTLEELHKQAFSTIPEGVDIVLEQPKLFEIPELAKNVTINYKGQEYNITMFYNKVLLPTQYIMQELYEQDWTPEELLKIGIIENSGETKAQEMAKGLSLFEQTNYYKKINTTSSVGAKGIFQVMPGSKNDLRTRYPQLQDFMNKNESFLKVYYKLNTKDWEILENASYGALQMYDSKKILLSKGIDANGKKLAISYNAGPGGAIKHERNGKGLTQETKKYIGKYAASDEIINPENISIS